MKAHEQSEEAKLLAERDRLKAALAQKTLEIDFLRDLLKVKERLGLSIETIGLGSKETVN